MGRLWDIKLPGWLWIIIFVLVYIVIKNPSVGVWFLSLPARLISGIGNFVIGVGHSYGAPQQGSRISYGSRTSARDLR